MTTHDPQTPIKGTAAGVPYVALPPPDGAETAPLILTWHLADPPRSETAMAAALPLRGLEAWRVYLGLPLLGSRLP
ncbi:MAG: alpha/beta hydrolase, partial [Dehalococcoidia bacterium]